jgi:hypothetical protein
MSFEAEFGAVYENAEETAPAARLFKRMLEVEFNSRDPRVAGIELGADCSADVSGI